MLKISLIVDSKKIQKLRFRGINSELRSELNEEDLSESLEVCQQFDSRKSPIEIHGNDLKARNLDAL